MQRTFYIFLLLAVVSRCPAQHISGSWYGHADVNLSGVHNNYLTELVIKQKGTHVEGIFGYYFRDKYQSYFIHGRYDPRTKEITILNIPIIFYGSISTVNSIDCITNFRGVIIQSKLGSTVKGSFYSDPKYKYTCPDLSVSYELDKSDNQQDSVIAAGPVTATIWKPKEDDFVVDAAAPKSDTPKAVADTSHIAAVAALDTAKTIAVLPPPPPPPDPVKANDKKIEASFNKRKAIGNHVYDIESDSVRLSFYDNGEIDGDSISVFVNNKLVLSHQGLEAKAFNLYLTLDSSRDINEISMFAENLGRIPPNTALMVITDGKNRYEVFMSSSLTENATIQLRRKRPQ
jgi:hypothetical protein